MRYTAFATRTKTISVVLPARNEETTIGAALAPLMRMRDEGHIDEVVVVDESTDWTPDIADSMGAAVHRQSDLCAELGTVCGKGDALWRSLSVARGDILLFLDADSTSIQRHYVWAMIGPLLADEAHLVKGYYQRPLGGDPNGGGRVNHLLAKPLLRAHFPHLSWVEQPLAGETALLRQTAEALPFVCGYGVEIAMLIDSFEAKWALTQANLQVHEHRHRPLAELSAMADEIIRVTLNRAGLASDAPLERPPWCSYRSGS